MRAWASTASALGTLVDHEQDVTLTDESSLDEADALDESTDARPDFNGVDGLEVSGEVVPVGYHSLDGGGNGDLWRLHWRRVLATTGRGNGEDSGGRPATGVSSEGNRPGARECGTHVTRLRGLGPIQRNVVALRSDM